jgi:hydroxymethylpyrimidine/phosphomethylpyrimidine kinase
MTVASRERAKTSVEEAAKRIEDCREFVHLLPEVGTNLVASQDRAKTLDEVVGLTGRIVKVEDRAVAVGAVKFGASKYMGNVLLTAMRYNPDFRAAINIKFSPEIIAICRELGMEAQTHQWAVKPKEVTESKCAIPFAIEELRRASEVVYDLGDIGIEASIIVFGRTATEVADKAIKIAMRYVKKG